MSKKCSKCERVKPMSEFYKDVARRDGLQSYCKICEKAWKNQNRKNNPKYQKRMKEYCKNRSQSIHGKYLAYIHAAKHRNRSFALSKIDFALLVSSPCYYCGELQENFNGVDRVNNDKGYTLDNCVSCCEMCNRMKLTKSKEEFIMKCKQIIEKQEVMTYSS